jgi:cytochrome c biogenesis protein CcdA
MMEGGSFLLALLSSLWFGILTSISPCPLATNIAAMSFLAQHVGHPTRALVRGVLYAVGRCTTYIGLSAIFVGGILASPRLAQYIQQYMTVLIGPLLIVVALFLLNVIRFSGFSLGANSTVQKLAERSVLVGPFLLGAVFALSFCPVSAGLFFGTLIPLSLQWQSVLWLPLLYGIGTALPVIAFAFVIIFSARSLGKVFNVLSHVEKWARIVTGVVFLLVGAYLTWRSVPFFSQWLGFSPKDSM